MARYKDAVCRQCRRENMKLYLKGDRCYSDKCAVTKRNSVPGQHAQGGRRTRTSEYALQLREKQKVRRYYGVLESQFEKYYEMASNRSGIAGANLLSILETRLDNIIYRLGFAMSRAEARLMVVHGHVAVNDRKTDIPSFLAKTGDKITIRPGSRDIAKIKQSAEANASRPVAKWLEADHENLEGRLVAMPARDDIDLPIEEHLIIELYSK